MSKIDSSALQAGFIGGFVGGVLGFKYSMNLTSTMDSSSVGNIYL